MTKEAICERCGDIMLNDKAYMLDEKTGEMVFICYKHIYRDPDDKDTVYVDDAL